MRSVPRIFKIVAVGDPHGRAQNCMAVRLKNRFILWPISVEQQQNHFPLNLGK
jgi:hypothetical protein